MKSVNYEGNCRNSNDATYQDYLKEHLLVNLHELLVPLLNVRSLAARIIIVRGAGRVVPVVGAPFENLAQNIFRDLV